MNLYEKLQGVEFMSITCDFWSNRSSKSFLVMTGHYLSRSFELHSTILDFSHLEQRHFSENIANAIYMKLDRLNVLDCVKAVTCDGASNMKKAFDHVGIIDRLWCLGHRLHLIVTNALGFWLKEYSPRVSMPVDESPEAEVRNEEDKVDQPEELNDEEVDDIDIDDDDEIEMVS